MSNFIFHKPFYRLLIKLKFDHCVQKALYEADTDEIKHHDAQRFIYANITFPLRALLLYFVQRR
jgi:hypothetical protein